MISNYLKVAFRSLWRHKSFSFINILGLSLGMPVCLLVILVISGQRDLDRFHEHSDRTYRIVTQATYLPTGSSDDVASAPNPLAPVLAVESPLVESSVRLFGFAAAASVDGSIIPVEGFYAEPALFDVFSFRLAQGDPLTALVQPYSAVVDPGLARAIFGDEDPMGKVISFAFGDVIVTGILAEPLAGERSHIDRPMYVSFSTVRALKNVVGPWGDPDNWNASSRYYQYVRLTTSDAKGEVESAIAGILARMVRPEGQYSFSCSLQPITGIAFGPELVNQIGKVMEGPVLTVFLIIALVVIVPVLFNYVSLTVARSLKRSREVGIRKVIGANRRDVLIQMLFESVLVAFLALIPAVLILDTLLPVFNGFQFVDYISVGWKYDWRIYAFFLGFATTAGVISGTIPSIILSSIQPAAALKGLTRLPGLSGITLRKVFLVIQFALSLLFITMTLIFHRQLSFMLGADYGFDKDHVVSVSLRDVPYERFRAEALRTPGVVEIAATSDFIGRANPDPGPNVTSPHRSEPIPLIRFSVSDNYLTDRKFTMIAGRSFDAGRSTEATQTMIINETAAHRMGFDPVAEAIGHVLPIEGSAPREVIGVVRDFHYARLQNTIDPVMLVCDPSEYYLAQVHVAPGQMLPVVSGLETVWASVSGSIDPMRYRFLDDYILGAYNDMRDITLFLTIIAGLAIAISCLGLLGMSIYSTEIRTREVGVRKVFGASVAHIVLLLSMDVVKMLAIAVVTVTPIVWAFVNVLFAQKVAFRVELGPGIFLTGFGIVLVAAMLTISSQTIRTARGNPIEALRNE